MERAWLMKLGVIAEAQLFSESFLRNHAGSSPPRILPLTLIHRNSIAFPSKAISIGFYTLSNV